MFVGEPPQGAAIAARGQAQARRTAIGTAEHLAAIMHTEPTLGLPILKGIYLNNTFEPFAAREVRFEMPYTALTAQSR